MAMPGTPGINSQKGTNKIGKTGTAVTAITAITVENNPTLSKAAHGLLDGAVVVVSGATGMTQINGLVGVVFASATNTFRLAGIDSTLFSPYTGTAGLVTPTLILLNGVKSTSGFDGQTSEIDDTDMDSDAKEYQGGLPEAGSFSLEKKVLKKANLGEQAINAAIIAGVPVPFEKKYANGEGWTFNWLVKGYSVKDGVDQISMGTVQGRISGAPVRL
jgi:hypothetical protein